jgi:acetolactate synthase-1/2/3 large subunit
VPRGRSGKIEYDFGKLTLLQRVADYIANYIYELGVKEVFMVAGGGQMFLTDGIARHPHLKAVCNHHEQASAMAVTAYAKYNQNLGAAFVTTGCGGTNTITGLLGAWQDNVACLFISGQSKRKETVRNSDLPLRQFGVQEADIIPIVQSITKYAIMINDPEEIAYHLDKAVYLAKSGRPGPVWLDIPLDVQGALIDEHALRRFSEEEIIKQYREEPEKEEMEKVLGLVQKAKRPIIIAGQGIRLAKAMPVFKVFVERYKFPVVFSRMGIDVLPSDSPFHIGRIGNKGDRAGNFAVQNADLVLAIGSRLSVSSTGHEYKQFAREAKIVVVDIDPLEHRKNTVRIDLFINADAKRFLQRMQLQNPPNTNDWLKKCQEWKAKWPVCLPEYANETRGINLYYFVDRLSRKLKPDSVVVADAGSAFYVTAQCIQLKEGQRCILSGGQAEMGNTLPAAIGVSVAKDFGEVLGITGDGSFQMNIQELQTIVHNKLPVKIFVWNNDGYLSIRATQSKFCEGRFIGTDKTSGVSFPDTRKIAKAYGIGYFKVSKSKELDKTLEDVLNYPGPVLCEVICLRDQEIVPTVASYKKADGTMVSKPLEDMYPFLDRTEFLSNMIVKPLSED